MRCVAESHCATVLARPPGAAMRASNPWQPVQSRMKRRFSSPSGRSRRSWDALADARSGAEGEAVDWADATDATRTTGNAMREARNEFISGGLRVGDVGAIVSSATHRRPEFAANPLVRIPFAFIAMRPYQTVLCVGLIAVLPAGLRAQQQPADLILTNARIYTVDDRRPFGEAMAITGGRVRFVGSGRGALAMRGPRTRVIDLDGRTVIPGMVDAHAHLLGLGMALRTVDLRGTKSYDEVIARVSARAREVPAGTWIIGRGWDQNDWGDTRFPSHEALSRAVAGHPVYLTRVDGHAALVNARAMTAAQLTANTPQHEGA